MPRCGLGLQRQKRGDWIGGLPDRAKHGCAVKAQGAHASQFSRSHSAQSEYGRGTLQLRPVRKQIREAVETTFR